MPRYRYDTIDRIVRVRTHRSDINEAFRDRLRLEEGTLHRAEAFRPSKQWRGRFSPVPAIAKSGLWLVQGLDGMPLSAAEFQQIADSCAPFWGAPTQGTRLTAGHYL